MGQSGGSLCGDSGFDRKDAAKPFLESVSFDSLKSLRLIALASGSQRGGPCDPTTSRDYPQLHQCCQSVGRTPGSQLLPWRFCDGQQSSTLATLITFAEYAVMPCFVLGVDRTEPPPTSLAVICSGGIARFVHRRHRLTRRHNVPRFCLTLLLQHKPLLTRAFYSRVRENDGTAKSRG